MARSAKFNAVVHLLVILSIVFGSPGTYSGFKQIELAERSIRISFEQVNPQSWAHE
jgi:hypothetical protein